MITRGLTKKHLGAFIAPLTLLKIKKYYVLSARSQKYKIVSFRIYVLGREPGCEEINV